MPNLKKFGTPAVESGPATPVATVNLMNSNVLDHLKNDIKQEKDEVDR